MKYIYILLIILSIVNQVISATPAKRIIALSPHSVEMLYAIGAGDRIIATVEFADYPEAALDIPRIGSYAGIQIESVLQLQPDLIIAWKDGNKTDDLEKLESLGMNMYYSHPKDIDAISHELINLGKLTGLTENAKKASDELASKYLQIKTRYKNKQKIRLFYQLWHEPLRSVGPNNWVQSLIEDCNGGNIFEDTDTAYPVVSLENILRKDPQVIIVPHHSGSDTVKNQIWKNWKNITAVKHQKIFTINGDLLHRFGPRAIDGLELLCDAIDSAR